MSNLRAKLDSALSDAFSRISGRRLHERRIFASTWLAKAAGSCRHRPWPGLLRRAAQRTALEEGRRK